MMNTIYLFHDREDSPDKLEKLEETLRDALPPTNFLRPYLPHIHPGVSAADSFNRITTKFQFPPNVTIIGAGWGGLIAAKLQESLRGDLKVIALAAPTMADGVILGKRVSNRLALYSTQDKSIMPHANWNDLTSEAYEYTPLMFHDIEANSYMLAYLIKTWLSGKSVEQEILSLK